MFAAIITALLNALRWFFSGVFTYALTQLFTKYGPRVLALGVIIAAIVTIVTGYLNFMFENIALLDRTIPETVTQVWGWVMPYNAIPCLTLLLTFRALSWFTKLGLKVLEVRSKAVS